MLKSKVLGPPGPGPVLPCCFALFMHLIKIHRAPGTQQRQRACRGLGRQR